MQKLTTEPKPHHSRTGRHADCRHRDEPVELARCRHCTGVDASPLKKLKVDEAHC